MAPGTLAPNRYHPLAHLTYEERCSAAMEALGRLVLAVASAEGRPTDPS